MSFQRLRSWCVLLAVAAALFWVSGPPVTRRVITPPPAAAAGPNQTAPAADARESARPTADPSTRTIGHAAPLAAIDAFTDWLTDFRRADAAAQGPLLGRGVELAALRRIALHELIKTDPRQALELAVPAGLRAQLPARIRSELEQLIDTRGDYEVSVSCFGPEAKVDRLVVAGGRRYEAFVFGRRLSQPTKFGLPIHGIAIDGAMAMAEEPFRVLDDAEKAARALSPEQLVVSVGGSYVELAGPTELDSLRHRLVAAESQPGPYVSDARSGSDRGVQPPTAALTSPPSWINGAKRILWIKVDFPDDPGAAFTDAEIEASCREMNEFYAANSQDKTSFSWSILPAVLRMPKEKAFYNTSGSSNAELYSAGRDAAKGYDAANGGTGAWNPEQFDRFIILHRRIAAYLYGGVAQIGGPRVGLNGSIGAGTIAHELGHCQSLYHSHYWLPSGTTPVGPGAHVEYGDTMDVMGGGGITQHFNAAQKYKLGYLDNTSITTVTQPGTYRIARQDHKNAAGLRGLRFAPANRNYEVWVEHRQSGWPSASAAQLDRLRHGVLLHWGTEKAPKFTPGVGTYLLDNTPGSTGGARDSAARIGETFVDPDTGISIRPIAAGGTAPNEYLDVQVAFGATDGNRNPALEFEVPAQLLARTNIIFNASATDPDGDPIYFQWDFGDGTVQPNLNSITRRYTKGGDYTLRVSAHDGKGGIASKDLALRIVDPLISWTQRGAGVTTNFLADVLFAGGKFVAVGSNQTVLTSPDGITWTTSTFPGGNSLTGIAHDGQRFVASGYRYSNPTQKGLAAYSEDGTRWTLVNIATGTSQFWGIAHGAGRFVMVGDDGIIHHSVDGATWTAAASDINDDLRAVTYADGLFVATGSGGRVLTSSDGITWANRSLPTNATTYGAARHKNLWQIRTGSLVYTSPDAVTWTRFTSNATNTGSFKPISVGGVFLVGGAGGLVEFTENQQTWASVRINSGTPTFRAATVGQDLIVLVGANGLIYSTDVPAAAGSAPPPAAPSLRIQADAIKVAAGKKNVLSANATGFTRLELYANGTKVSEVEGSYGALAWTPGAIGNYVLTVRGIDASGASAVSTAFPAIAGFTGWQWRNPTPLGANLRSAVRAHDRWWIVGGGGTLATLDDAGNFIPVDFPTTQQLNSIAYANGRFVIGTLDADGATKEDIGGIWTSSDGHGWTPFLTGALDSANVNCVLFAANRWIGLCTGGTIVTSSDGINWRRTASGLAQSINAGTTGNGLIVAVASGGRIITSTDGLAWTERASGVTADLRAVTFANGTFVAAGSAGAVLVSTNGTTWRSATSGTTANLYAAAFVRGAFVVAGDDGALRSSTNGDTWTAGSLGATDTLFVGASGDDGILLGRDGEVYLPTSATTWRRLSRGTTESRQAVIYAGGRFVAVGASVDPTTRAPLAPVESSPDGVTWTRAAATPGFTSLNAIAYGQGRYVAVGVSSGVFTSTDAVTWTKSPFTSGGTLTGVAAGPGGFVAVNLGQAIFSSDTGETWTQRATGVGAPLRAVAYGAGKYVTVGDRGLIRHSADGVTWTAATSGTTVQLLKVAWFDDLGFIATGASGTMIASTDGQTWRPIEAGVSETLTAIEKTPLGWVAAGGTAGMLIVSLDGESWSPSAIPLDKSVRGLAVGPNAVVAVGDGGAILSFELAATTPPVIIAQPVAPPAVLGGNLRLTVGAQNAAGAVYQWMKDGVAIPGADKPAYTIANLATGSTGTYTVSVTTGASRVVSSPAVVGFGAPSNPGRLINLSILTTLTSATDGFTFGVVIGGAGTTGGKALLVRAAGPSLVPLGVDGALDDPRLEFFSGQTKVGENDNWGGSEALRNANVQVGAFAFVAANSRDAALMLPSLASGNNSAQISGSGTGTVLAELYDATPAAAFTSQTPRLINVSVLKHIGSGVTAGFVIGGGTPRTILIRAVGPTLGEDPFGVPGVVSDPRLTLYRGSTAIGTNDNWGGGPTLSGAFTRVGAFALPANSRDAALLTDLTPGNYTVEVTGAGTASGVALIEVYEVP